MMEKSLCRGHRSRFCSGGHSEKYRLDVPQVTLLATRTERKAGVDLRNVY